MKKYRVIGEYGPVHCTIEREIQAENKTKAIDLFVSYVKKNHPIQWERMGMSNVSAYRV